MDLFYEKRVIGAIVNGVIRPEDADLDASDFTDEGLRQIFSTIKSWDGEKIDAAVLLDRSDYFGFWTAHDLEDWGGRVQSIGQAYEAISKVKDASIRQILVTKASEIARDESSTAGALLTAFKQVIEDCEALFPAEGKNFIPVAEYEKRVMGILQDLHEGRDFSVETGFPAYDEAMNGGYSRGDLHIVAGMTGQGKSAFALNCALYQAENKKKVALVSREMSAIENIIRLMGAKDEIERWAIKRNMTATVLERAQEAFLKIKGLPVYIDTETSTIEALRANTKMAVSAGECDILYVDYLQLLGTKALASTRAEEIGRVSRQLKEIAMANEIPVVALAQFNRGGTNVGINELLAYLKESSSIEQDATTVTAVALAKDRQPMVIDADLHLLKNRNGRILVPLPMRFRGEVFKFFQLAE